MKTDTSTADQTGAESSGAGTGATATASQDNVEIEQLITAKVAAGLSRSEAIAAIERQQVSDARHGKPTKKELATEVQRLKAELDRRDAQAAQADADEATIADKVSKGLSRQQAIHVIQRQRTVDTHRAAHVVPAIKADRAKRTRRNATMRFVTSGGQIPQNVLDNHTAPAKVHTHVYPLTGKSQ